MKNVIKINKLATACILAGSLTMFSCSDFLNQEPKTSLTEQEAFSNLENIAPTVDGLYTAFRDSKSGREGLTFSLLGLDESKQGIVQMDDAAQASLDLYNGLLNSMSTQVDKCGQEDGRLLFLPLMRFMRLMYCPKQLRMKIL